MGSRIRTLKPEIWTSRDIGRLSAVGRLAFIAMITQADDEGRLHTDAHHLATAFLSPGVETPDVQSQMVVMERRGMIRQYRDAKKEPCVALLNWNLHQRIDHPTPSRIQEPPPVSRGLARSRERSRPSAGARADQIRPTGSDRIRPDQTDRSNSAGAELALVLEQELSVPPEEQVFAFWLQSTDRTGRTVLDDKRRLLIRKALKAYPLEDVLDAVDGWRFDKHHRGENDRARPYNDLSLILRDPEHIERFRDFKRSPTVLSMPARKASISTFYRDQAAKLAREGD